MSLNDMLVFVTFTHHGWLHRSCTGATQAPLASGDHRGEYPADAQSDGIIKAADAIAWRTGGIHCFCAPQLGQIDNTGRFDHIGP